MTVSRRWEKMVDRLPAMGVLKAAMGSSRQVIFLVLACLPVSGAGCSKRDRASVTPTPSSTETTAAPAASDTVVSGTGMVVHMDLEGGFYGIVGDDGGRWDPSNLPEDFRADSLRVRYQVKPTDLMSTHMWGRTVLVVTIERID